MVPFAKRAAAGARDWPSLPQAASKGRWCGCRAGATSRIWSREGRLSSRESCVRLVGRGTRGTSTRPRRWRPSAAAGSCTRRAWQSQALPCRTRFFPGSGLSARACPPRRPIDGACRRRGRRSWLGSLSGTPEPCPMAWRARCATRERRIYWWPRVRTWVLRPRRRFCWDWRRVSGRRREGRWP